jgi:hypothetical protein
MSFNNPYLYDLYSTKDGTEKGYCVEFDFQSFDNIIEDGANNDEFEWVCPLYYVVYADKLSDINDRRVVKHIKSISDRLKQMSLIMSECSEQEMVDDLRVVVFKELEEIAYLFKNKSGFDENHIWRDWTAEKELRIMKCVRGESNNIVTSKTNKDENGLYYRNYISTKK